ELELLARPNAKLRPRFRAHADPVEAGGRLDRAVRLDRDGKAALVQGIEQGTVGLQQRLATGEHDESMLASAAPFLHDCLGKLGRGRVRAAARAVGADEI